VSYLRDPQFKTATSDKIEKRRAWFLALVRETQIAGDAWIISSPGCDTVTLETLTTSGFPDELRARKYPLVEIEGGSRILPHAYHQPMEIGANGELVPAIQGSTRPTTVVIHGRGCRRRAGSSFRRRSRHLAENDCAGALSFLRLLVSRARGAEINQPWCAALLFNNGPLVRKLLLVETFFP
jgi:hypothetical protein